jgi:hypothetical protein
MPICAEGAKVPGDVSIGYGTVMRSPTISADGKRNRPK